MKTTLKQQQEAIAEAMRVQTFRVWIKTGSVQSPMPTSDELQADPQWSALNDAASTIAALRLSNEARKKFTKM